MGHNRGFQLLTPPLDFNVDLAPDLSPLGGILEDVGQFVQQRREKKAAQEHAQDVARTTLEALEDQPSGEVAAKPVNRQFDGLAGLDPGLASEVTDILQSGDVEAMGNLRNEAADSVLLGEAIQKLPSHAAKLNRFRQHVARKNLQGEELTEALNIMNASPDDFDTAMVRAQAVGGAVLAVLPEPQKAPSARNKALARLSAIAPDQFKAVTDVIGARQTRRATAAETARKRDLPLSAFGKEFADIQRLTAEGDIPQAESGQMLDRLFGEVGRQEGRGQRKFSKAPGVIVTLPGGGKAQVIPVLNERTGEIENKVVDIEGEIISRQFGETGAALTERRVGEAGEKRRATGEAARFQGHIDKGLDAADQVAVINRSLELLQTVETGGIDAANLRAQQFLGVEGADEAELSANLGKAMISQLRETFGAAFTEREGARLARIEAGFGKSTEGNVRLINRTKKLLTRAAQRGINAAERSGDFDSADEIRDALEFSLTPDQGDLVFNPETGKVE